MQAEVKIKASFNTTQDKNLIENAKNQGEKAGKAFSKSASKGIRDLGSGLKLLQGQAGALSKSLASVFSGGWIAAAGVAIAALGAKLNQIWEKMRYTQQDRINEANKQKDESVKRNEALKEQIKTTQNYFQRLVQLSQKESLNNIQKMEAITLIQSLTKEYGDLGIRMDETTGTIYGMIGAYQRLQQMLGKKRQKALDDVVDKSQKAIAENKTFKQMNKSANQTYVTYSYPDNEGNMMTTTRKKTAQERARDQQWLGSTQGKIDILQQQRDAFVKNQIGAERVKEIDQLITKLKQLQLAEEKSAFFKKTGFETDNDLIDYITKVNKQLEKSSDELGQMTRKAETNKMQKRFDVYKSYFGDNGKEQGMNFDIKDIQQNILKNKERINDAKGREYLLNKDYISYYNKLNDDKISQAERLKALVKLKDIQMQIAEQIKLQHKYEKQNIALQLKRFDIETEIARMKMAKRQKDYEQLTPAQEKVKFLNNEAANLTSANYQDNKRLFKGTNRNKGINQYLVHYFASNLDKVYTQKFNDDVIKTLTDFESNINAGNIQGAIKNLAFMKNQDFSLTPGEASEQKNKNVNKSGGPITNEQLSDLRQFQKVLTLMQKAIDTNKLYSMQMTDIKEKQQQLSDIAQKHYKNVLNGMDEQRAIQKALIQGDYARAKQLKIEAELKKQGVLLDQKAIKDIKDKQFNSQSLNLYQTLKQQSQSLLDKVMDPNDKQYAIDRRIADMQKQLGRKLDLSESWDVEDLVDLQFQLKQLKQSGKNIKYEQLKTNQMTARGGFAGGVYVPNQSNYAQITASNAQQQTALIQQIRGYMANLNQTINRIP